MFPPLEPPRGSQCRTCFVRDGRRHEWGNPKGIPPPLPKGPRCPCPFPSPQRVAMQLPQKKLPPQCRNVLPHGAAQYPRLLQETAVCTPHWTVMSLPPTAPQCPHPHGSAMRDPKPLTPPPKGPQCPSNPGLRGFHALEGILPSFQGPYLMSL